MARVAVITAVFVLLAIPAMAEVPLEQLLEEFGADLRWEPYRRIGTIDLGNTRVTFRPDSGALLVNNSSEVRSAGIVSRRGALFAADEAAVYLRELYSRYVPGDGPIITAVVLDPGHGGKDPGTNHSHVIGDRTIHLIEKDIVLGISMQLRQMLVERYPTKRIVLTRDADVFLELEERVEIANNIELNEEMEAIIFISIHANASLNPNTYGYEVWYLPPEFGRGDLISRELTGANADDLESILNTMKDEEFTVESVLLARHILDGFDTMIGDRSKNLGLKEESWFVVRNAKMPSVLVELGFVTNSEEAARMVDPVHLRKMAVGLYNGITEFISEFESKKGFTE